MQLLTAAMGELSADSEGDQCKTATESGAETPPAHSDPPFAGFPGARMSAQQPEIVVGIDQGKQSHHHEDLKHVALTPLAPIHASVQIARLGPRTQGHMA